MVSRPPAVSEAGGESVAQGGAAAGVSRPPAVPSAGDGAKDGRRRVRFTCGAEVGTDKVKMTERGVRR